MLHKQKGFTLLELLVVITLLALLSVGALVAYDGVGDNASATAAANNMQTVDRTIRQYNAVTGKFPNQWDSLADANDASLSFDGITAVAAADLDDNEVLLPKEARKAFGGWDLTSGTVDAPTIVRVLEVLADYGIDELQVVDSAVANTPGAVPNTLHNEGSNAAALEVEADETTGEPDGFSAISIFPTAGTCTAGNTSIAQNFDGDLGVDNTAFIAQRDRINSINDFLEDHACNLILALGFGGDAGKSMQNSSVQMVSSPTYASRNVNPARNYGRFVGLFHMGKAAESADTALPTVSNIGAADIFPKPRLIAILTPEGKTLDQMLAEATASVE